ncbi:MAG: 30S ribosomal protein S12 methylthiotransferase RimO [Planctomycetes bacterium]|nr:30S ribosomal protein S12 methylthiotransferase RimO [Planctomycetota bacterium]
MPSPASKTKSKRSPIQTVSLVSLGCPKNLVDSEKMLGMLAESGLAPISYEGDGGFGGADAVVVNTCGFLEASKDESLGVIKEAILAKERGEVQRVIVAGCLVQRHRAKMLEWAPGIDAMVGVFDRDKIVEAVKGGAVTRARSKSALDASDKPSYWIAANALTAAKDRGLKTAGLTVNGKDGNGIGYFEDDSARLRLTPRHYAYLRISEGCNQNCAFCTIPSIRGKMRSKPLDRIAQETRELIADGAFELLLIGQDTTSYGDDIGMGLDAGVGLPGLLRTISDTMTAEGCKGWLRLMYAYPTNFGPRIVEAFADLVQRGRLLPYLDIPLQHASDKVLASMRRHVTRRQQEDLIGSMRERITGMSIRTTFISGFPGETEKDHDQLLDFISTMRFEAVGVFEYSKEPGTVAGTMEEDASLAVPAEVKARRRGEIMELQQKIAFERAAAMAAEFDEKKPQTTGRRLDVVIDDALRTTGRKTSGVGDGGRLYRGRTYFQAPQIDAVTYIQSREKLASGEVVPCVIVGSDGYDLIAKPVAEVEKRVGLKVLR